MRSCWGCSPGLADLGARTVCTWEHILHFTGFPRGFLAALRQGAGTCMLITLHTTI